VSDTLAEVLKTEIDWTRLPASTPPAIVRLLRRCLERDPQRRLRDIGDVRLEIEDAIAVPAGGTNAGAPAPGAGPPPSFSRERRFWVLGLGAVIVAGAAGVAWLRPAAPSLPAETRFQV